MVTLRDIAIGMIVAGLVLMIVGFLVSLRSKADRRRDLDRPPDRR